MADYAAQLQRDVDERPLKRLKLSSAAAEAAGVEKVVHEALIVDLTGDVRDDDDVLIYDPEKDQWTAYVAGGDEAAVAAAYAAANDSKMEKKLAPFMGGGRSRKTRKTRKSRRTRKTRRSRRTRKSRIPRRRRS
jgi:hypothetical protein